MISLPPENPADDWDDSKWTYITRSSQGGNYTLQPKRKPPKIIQIDVNNSIIWIPRGTAHGDIGKVLSIYPDFAVRSTAFKAVSSWAVVRWFEKHIMGI